MPDIFDIDFNQQVPEILPVDKRHDKTLSLVRALMFSLQWCRDLLFTSYKVGATASAYAAGTYNHNDQVIFEKSVYYSLIDGNTTDPTNTDNWLKIQDNFIGVDERVRFNGQVVVLEYALNKRFGGIFRQPGSSSPSDIYILYVASVPSGFHVGLDEASSSWVGLDTSSDSIGGPYPFSQPINFQINFLNSLYILTNEPAIRDFVDLYIPISLNYSIVPY